MTDTPVPRPPSRADAVKAFIGDLARPLSIISTSLAASAATVIIAHKVQGFAEAALYIAAVYAGVAGLYWGKAWEVVNGGRAAEAEAAPPAPPAPSGPKPPWERGR